MVVVVVGKTIVVVAIVVVAEALVLVVKPHQLSLRPGGAHQVVIFMPHI